jgi:hypothetical protein
MGHHGAVDDAHASSALELIRKEELEERTLGEGPTRDVARFADLASRQRHVIKANAGIKHSATAFHGHGRYAISFTAAISDAAL